MNRIAWIAVAAGAAFSMSACARTPEAAPVAGTAAPRVSAAASPGATTAAPVANVKTPASTDASLPKVLVHKSPSCGCCAGWVDHLRRHGFAVDVQETDDLEPVRKRLGVPAGKGSCHTAQVGRRVVEGHVPAGDIKRLLAMDDDARGLVLPGMPLGSPGMEVPDGTVQPYTVERVNADGSTKPFANHGG